jgi:hypothetical protein
MARRSTVQSMWSRRSYSRKRRPKYVFQAKKLVAAWESFIATRARTGTSRMMATEGPAKGLELLDRDELKGLEGPEREESAMVGGRSGAGLGEGLRLG